METEIEMFGKKKETLIRLGARHMLGLYAAEQSLAKLFRAPSVGWTHINITEAKMATNAFEPERWRVRLEGKFFGRNTPHFYSGTLQVSVCRTDSGYWRTEFIFIECTEPENGFPVEPDGYSVKSWTAYLSKHDHERSSGRHTFDDVVPTLTSRYDVPE